MKKILFILLLLITIPAQGQQKDKSLSIILLGDVHYDLLKDHDMDWLRTKPDDLRQVTTEYTIFTKNTWKPFSKVVRHTVKKHQPPVKAILQLGDLSEGLAGSPQKAEQMAKSVFSAIKKAKWDAPVIITKGNHDITGPGAKEAFENVYLPNMARLAGHTSLSTANYSTQIDEMLFVCYDPWDKSVDGLQTLEDLLTSSSATHKFILIHEPVIPVNERCWHVYRNEPQKRERLLQIIARQKAIVLCAHLHLYSVVRRDTQWGPIVQIMVNSVIKDKTMLKPERQTTIYDASLVNSHPNWQPETFDQRMQWIRNEMHHVKYFKQVDLPGYGVLSFDKTTEEIVLKYYAGFGKKPYDVINITNILN